MNNLITEAEDLCIGQATRLLDEIRSLAFDSGDAPEHQTLGEIKEAFIKEGWGDDEDYEDDKAVDRQLTETAKSAWYVMGTEPTQFNGRQFYEHIVMAANEGEAVRRFGCKLLGRHEGSTQELQASISNRMCRMEHIVVDLGEEAQLRPYTVVLGGIDGQQELINRHVMAYHPEHALVLAWSSLYNDDKGEALHCRITMTYVANVFEGHATCVFK